MRKVILMSLSQWKDKTKKISEDAIGTALTRVYTAKTIHERVDALYQVILCCDENPQKIEIAIVQQLKSQALEFASYILDANNPKEAWEKLQKRQFYKKINPSYLPWHIPKISSDPADFKTRQEYLKSSFKKASVNAEKHRNISLNEYGRSVDQKSENRIRYLSNEEREQYRVFIKDGKLFKIFTDVEDEKSNLSIEFLDTGDYRIPFVSDDEDGYTSGKGLIVTSPQGDIFFCSGESSMAGTLCHSSLLAGRSVLFAGTAKVTKGVLQTVDNNSGHYTPGFMMDSKTGESYTEVRQITPFIQFLRQTKLITRELQFEIFDLETKGFSPRLIWNPNMSEGLKLLLEILKSNYFQTRTYSIWVKFPKGIEKMITRIGDQKELTPILISDIKSIAMEQLSSNNSDRDLDTLEFYKTLSTLEKDKPTKSLVVIQSLYNKIFPQKKEIKELTRENIVKIIKRSCVRFQHLRKERASSFSFLMRTDRELIDCEVMQLLCSSKMNKDVLLDHVLKRMGTASKNSKSFSAILQSEFLLYVKEIPMTPAIDESVTSGSDIPSGESSLTSSDSDIPEADIDSSYPPKTKPKTTADYDGEDEFGRPLGL